MSGKLPRAAQWMRIYPKTPAQPPNVTAMCGLADAATSAKLWILSLVGLMRPPVVRSVSIRLGDYQSPSYLCGIANLLRFLGFP